MAVLGLVANALLLIVRGRVKETAILQTIGFSRFQISWLVVIEGILLGPGAVDGLRIRPEPGRELRDRCGGP